MKGFQCLKGTHFSQIIQMNNLLRNRSSLRKVNLPSLPSQSEPHSFKAQSRDLTLLSEALVSVKEVGENMNAGLLAKNVPSIKVFLRLLDFFHRVGQSGNGD